MIMGGLKFKYVTIISVIVCLYGVCGLAAGRGPLP